MGKSYRHSQHVQRNRMCLGQGNRAGFLRTEITPLASEITLHTKYDRIYRLFRAQSYLNSAILQNMPAQTWRLILFRQNTWLMSRMAVKMKARNGSHNSVIQASNNRNHGYNDIQIGKTKIYGLTSVLETPQCTLDMWLQFLGNNHTLYTAES